MYYNALIIGYGSIGKKHFDILSKSQNIKSIYILTRQKIKNSIKDLNQAKNLHINFIIICSETHKHIVHLRWIEKNFKNIKVLIEKPVLHKFLDIKLRNNKYFIGYNMRFNPLIKKILGKNDKIWSVNIICSSFLPNWRKNNYTKSYSAEKKKGGGVLLDLSHELDYARYLFGNYKIINHYVKKISNLKINAEDIAIILSKNNKGTLINFNLNYFSKIPIRYINIEGENISLEANLISGKLHGIIKKKKVNYQYKNFENFSTYKIQTRKILKNDFVDLCKLSDGLDINKMVHQLK